MGGGIIRSQCVSVPSIYSSLPKNIYHYTSPNGIKGILDDKATLFFTKYDCLNDKNEGELIEKAYIEAVSNYRSLHPEANEFCDCIIDVKRSNLTFLPAEGDIVRTKYDDNSADSCYADYCECEPYICCFSCEDDSLSMWKYFSKGNGYEAYSIGFDKNSIIKHSGIIFEAFPVVYDRKYQNDILMDTIDIGYINYSKCSHPISIVRQTISLKLLSNSFQLKDKAFEHEKEYRIVLFMPKNLKEYAKKHAVNIPSWLKNKFRVDNGALIPYVEVPINPNSIEDIVVGPFHLKSFAKKNLSYYIQENDDYKRVKIRESGLPLRF